MRFQSLVCAVMVLSSSLSVQAQVRGGHPAGTTQGATRSGNEPCWKVAGISQSALQQRRNLEESARSQIASVCADASLTPKQKAEEIKAIHERTRQAILALISPQQEEALKACRESRGREEAPHVAHGMGPCGELPESQEPPGPHK